MGKIESLPSNPTFLGYHALVFHGLVAGLLLVLALGNSAHACTLFAAAGSRGAGGGTTIIVKNRDRTPRQSALKVFTSRNGYRHDGRRFLSGSTLHHPLDRGCRLTWNLSPHRP